MNNNEIVEPGTTYLRAATTAQRMLTPPTEAEMRARLHTDEQVITALRAQVEDLTQRVKELEDGLRPFAAFVPKPGPVQYQTVMAELKLDDTKRAAELLKTAEPPDIDPYEVFGRWAAENGYDLDTQDGRDAAIAAYGRV